MLCVMYVELLLLLRVLFAFLEFIMSEIALPAEFVEIKSLGH